jgi:hypothetical protein
VTFLERLQAHKGRLIRLKTQIHWYDGRGYDGFPGRFCLLLDAVRFVVHGAVTGIGSAAAGGRLEDDGAALLLIDGRPQWVWVAEQDVEVIDETR